MSTFSLHSPLHLPPLSDSFPLIPSDPPSLYPTHSLPLSFPLSPSHSLPPSSLLSHSAVVARELGLPTIVGVSGGLMKRLKTGMRVCMNGGKGTVTLLGEDQAVGSDLK